MRAVILSAITGLIGGILITYYVIPAKVTTIDKIVTKEIHTNTIITKKADGTTITIIKDDSLVKEDNHSSETIIKSSKYSLYGIMGTNWDKIGTLYYGAGISKEILGPFTFGIFVTNQVSAGITLGVNF